MLIYWFDGDCVLDWFWLLKGFNDERFIFVVVFFIYIEIKNNFFVILLMFLLINLVFVWSNNSVIVIDI